MLSSSDHRQLTELIGDLYNGTLDDQRRARLEQWLLEDAEARNVYRRYVNLHASLKQYQVGYKPADVPSKPGSPVLGFLGDVFQQGADFLSRGLVVSILLAIGLPGILFLILALHVTRQPAPVVPVAKVTQTYECIWDKGSKPLPVGKGLFAGDQLQLSKGLVEITFDKGAKVLLKGPSTFNTSSTGQGFLHAGSLVASVPSRAVGFTVQTPTTTVVDLGTEFGVSVEDEKGTAEVQVFQGKVELKAGKEGAEEKLVCRHIEAGHAVRVEPTGPKGKLVVQEIALPVDCFVRHLPTPPVKPPKAHKPVKPAIVGNFSGGNGETQPDQFPGITGGGWGKGWVVMNRRASQEAPGAMEIIARVENAHPMRGGGNYLRFSATRKTLAGLANGAIARYREALSHDHAAPHVISFDLRADELAHFDDPFDSITISGDVFRRCMTKNETGWAIRASGSDEPGERIPPRHWRFLDGDRKGKYRQVDSGIKMEPGRVYTFRVFIDPDSKTWVPSIAVDGGTPKKFKPMGMRSPGTPFESRYWRYINFQWQMKGGNQGEDREKIGFSIDSIRIEQAEQPKATITQR